MSARLVRLAGSIVRPLVVAVAVTLVVAASSYALVATLPEPTAGDRLGVRLLHHLEHARAGGAVLHLGRVTIRARCRRVPRGRTLVTLSTGDRLLLAGTRVVERRPRARRGGNGGPEPGAEFWSVAADLSGSHRLYASLLKGRLLRGAPIVVGVTRFRGTPAYRVRLGREPPAVELVVARGTLMPLAARYRSKRIDAWSRLLPRRPGPRQGC